MAQDVSTIIRPRVLTNSAAEFLETRAQDTLGAEVVGPASPQYVPVRDQFVTRRDIQRVDYHAESAARLKQLEATLLKFVETIRERGFAKKLNIELKDLKTYSVNDVLSITTQIEDRYRNADKVKNPMGMIRRCFRTAGENHGQLNRLLKFVPNDSYGTVISGGFTVILGALERSEKLRTDIYESLADIPAKLEEVQDLAEVHYQSADLQRRADSVLVAIFVVLERIVNELTQNMTRKGMSLMFKGDRHSFDITEAIQDLEKRLKEFRTQAEICLQQRFGRMDQRVTRSMIAAENSEMMIAESGLDMADIRQRFERFERRWENDVEAQMHRQAKLEQIGQALLDAKSTQEIEAIRHEALQTNVYNSLYIFLTGNPSFDSSTGLMDRMQAMRIQKELAFPLDPKDPSSTWAKRNKRVVKNWLGHMQPVHYAINEDLRECLHGFGSFATAGKDQVQWMITSNELHHWLRTAQSSVLAVEPQTCPDGVSNPLSFTSAFLVKLLKKQSYPTICFFSRSRANVSMDEKTSGPEAMLASLFAQLLIQMKKKRPGIDLAGLPGPGEQKTGLGSGHVEMEKIRQLLDELPDNDCVYVVLDFAVDLTGAETQNYEALRYILDLTKESRLVVKVLITAAFSTTLLEGMDHTTLWLPDVADSGSQDINPSFFEGDTLDSIKHFETQRQEVLGITSTSSEDEKYEFEDESEDVD